MARAMNRLPASLTLAFLLSACASTPGEYPSLARRPIERVTGTFTPPPPPPAPAPVDPAVARQIDSLLDRVRAVGGRAGFAATAQQGQTAEDERDENDLHGGSRRRDGQAWL